MSLTPGSRIGPYHIVSPLGAGGMGEVYRARDTRLGRDVALKVLPAGAAVDADRLVRFEQESRTVASVNHPNIVVLYDVGTYSPTAIDAGTTGTAGAFPYLVIELLDGSTLRDRLEAGALPIRKAVEYARQIALGLAAAHDKGIVHRDLKPDNVFITRDDRIKILDFGLAKLTEPEPALSGATALATSPRGTMSGTVLGTVGYMAPEQVRGTNADHRADIFAFGVVLYEMLTGQRAFRGDTAMDVMMAIAREDPPALTTVRPDLPSSLVRVVDRCLEKDPGVRFQSTHDLAFALEGATSSSSSSPSATSLGVSAPSRRRDRRAWSVAAAFAALALKERPTRSGHRMARASGSSPRAS